MTSQLYMVEETGGPCEKHRLTPSPGNFVTCPGWDWNPGSGDRQLAVSGNALDHTAIRAGLQTQGMKKGSKSAS